MMLMALLGAVAVLAGGGYVLDRVVRRGAAPAAEPPPDAPAVADGPGRGAGGYTVLGGERRDRPRPPIPGPVLARVRELLALGRGVEAVRIMRDGTGMDLRQAQEAVDDVRAGRVG